MELARLIIKVLIAAVNPGSSSPKDSTEIVKVVIGALGPIIAALIVGVAGVLITNRYAKQREEDEREAVDRRHQKDLEAMERRYSLDTEIDTRSHAVELTKLELARKLEAWKVASRYKRPPLRPVIQDFLALYRDLGELFDVTPKELYERIDKHRISRPSQRVNVPDPVRTDDSGSVEAKVNETSSTNAVPERDS